MLLLFFDREEGERKAERALFFNLVTSGTCMRSAALR